MISIEIPGRPPTPNETNRRVAQARWRERREWRETAGQAAILARRLWEVEHGEDWQPITKASVRITFLLPDLRRRDWDNLVGSTKPLFDGLVDAGILADDSVSCLLVVSTDVELRPKLPGTRFEIETAL